MDDLIGGRLPPGDAALINGAYSTLSRIRAVTVRLRVKWVRLDDLPPEDEASLKACLAQALGTWIAEHGVTGVKTDGPNVEVRKSEPYIQVDI
jgi:hypothetical protein